MNTALGAIHGLARDASPCPWDDDLAGYAVHRYSKRQVIDAGKLIATRSPYATEELVSAFRLAHDWRGAHIRPLRRVRSDLMAAARTHEFTSVVAARLKRMQSIRRKLQRRPESLFQLQDIAGARAIMKNMAAVNALLAHFHDGGSRFEVQREWDYVANPKVGGYRSAHLRLVCPSDTDDEAYRRLLVEVQIRTRLQHSWATAVEAVGLVRREELKGGEGDARWLRLFTLMAAEFAVEEGCPLVPEVPEDRAGRIQELRDVVLELDAIRRLESMNRAVHEAEQVRGKGDMFYLVQYDSANKEVRVRSYSRFSRVYEQFFLEENNTALNTVTVEVDRAEDLRRAYPNYYLDVQDFTDRLKQLVLPRPKRTPTPAKPSKSGHASKWAHLSWLRDYPGLKGR
ncbi:MAG TPA: hypothetical protein VN694_13335 [Caulobacteraceae bacterium]|nr:hypothetical protein [Caulobacteraceae bacterium]